MHSSQKNPETLFPKRKKPRTHLATTTPRPTTTTTTKLTTNNNHQEEKKHKKLPKTTTTDRGNCQETQKIARNTPIIKTTSNPRSRKSLQTHHADSPISTSHRSANPSRWKYSITDLKPTLPIWNPRHHRSANAITGPLKPKPLKILYHRFETHAITNQQTPSPPRLQRTLLQPIASQRVRERRWENRKRELRKKEDAQPQRQREREDKGERE